MDIFEEIEKWKREHRDEWKKIEEHLKLLEEMGLKRDFKPEPLFPGFDYHYEVSGPASPSIKLKI
jgi:Txe/YoeB family toxin of Txe-Axe toxin-antitoxin module